MNEFFVYKSNTGINLVIYPTKIKDIIDVTITIKSGSLNDEMCTYGMAHFLEHLLFKGSKNYSNILSKLDATGAYYNAYTSYEITEYKIYGLSKFFNIYLSILVDMFCNSSLAKEYIEKEKKIIIEELNINLSKPNNIIFHKINEMLSPENGRNYFIPVIGTIEDINRITYEKLLAYKNKYYCNSNSLFTIKGDVTVDLIEKINEIFSKILNINIIFNKYNYKIENINDIIYYRPITKKLKLKDRYFFITDNIDNYNIYICFPSWKKFSNNVHVISILSIILSGNLTSYIPKILREKFGVSYDQGFKNINYDDYGVFLLYVLTTKPYKSILLILHILLILLKTGITEENLNNAKNTYLMHMNLSYQTTSDFISESILYKQQVKNLNAVNSICNNITVSDVNNLLNIIIKKNYLYLLVVGSKPLNKTIVKKIYNTFNKLLQ